MIPGITWLSLPLQGKLILGIADAAKFAWKMPPAGAKQQLLKQNWEGMVIQAGIPLLT